MVRILVGIVAFFWLGVVVAEVVRQAQLIDAIGSPFLWGAVTALLFVAAELVHTGIRCSAQRTGGEATRMVTAYHLSLGLICLAVLATIPFLWWGVMKELARAPIR